MIESRKIVRHVRWSEKECDTLKNNYPSSPYSVIEELLPGRTRTQIHCKANGLGLVRHREPKRTKEQTREAKRLHMANKRAADPDLVRAYQRGIYHQNREERKTKLREYASKRFFWSRAMSLRGDDRATAKELAGIWKRQRGLCGLTGRRLDRSAQLDHIIPRAKGGKDSLKNLRWVCREVNYAKRDLTDDEFISVCSDVIRWIGERITQVEAIP